MELHDALMAFVTSAGVLLTVVLTKYIQRLTALKVDGDRREDKLDSIHVLVNSNLTRVKEQLAEALAKIAKLEEILAAMNIPLPPHV